MDNHRLQEELRQAKRELTLFYEIGNLLRAALLLDEVSYLILAAATSHEGLGCNRAILFLVDDSGLWLEGVLGVGPAAADESLPVWKSIQEKKITLEGQLDVYRKSNKKIDLRLNAIVQTLRYRLGETSSPVTDALLQDKAMIWPSTRTVPDPLLSSLGLQEFAIVPLRGKNETIGVMVADNLSTKKPMTDADLQRLIMLANHAGLALENAKTYSQVVKISQEDALTHLSNYGHFQLLLRDTLREAVLKKIGFSLLVFDVDDFKKYNDLYGHPAGDEALKRVAQAAKSMMRKMDHLARYGGEEFVAILPGSSKAEAVKLAERLRQAIERETNEMTRRGKLFQPLTVSMGVAAFPEDAQDKDKLMYCADGALYEAKKSGKNKVFAYERPGSQNKAPMP